MVVGIVMPSLRYAYFAGTLELLQGLLAREGYTVLLSTANHDPQAELDGVRALMAQGVDFVVLFAAPAARPERRAAGLARRAAPALLVGAARLSRPLLSTMAARWLTWPSTWWRWATGALRWSYPSSRWPIVFAAG